MNRDYEEIEMFCKEFLDFCENVRGYAARLESVVRSSEGSLQDEVGRKAVSNVEDLAKQLCSIVDNGEEAVTAIRKSNKEIGDEFEDLKKKLY